jgi:Type VI secretion system effector, Hcp
MLIEGLSVSVTSQEERVMRKRNTMDETRALQNVTGGGNGRVAGLLAAISLLGVSAGFVSTASASQLPKVSTPQVRVNTGVHVNTVNVHPVTGTNSSALKVGSAHQFNPKNGAKGNAATPREEQLLLKLDGIKGESQDDGHKNQIEIQSYR